MIIEFTGGNEDAIIEFLGPHWNVKDSNSCLIISRRNSNPTPSMLYIGGVIEKFDNGWVNIYPTGKG